MEPSAKDAISHRARAFEQLPARPRYDDDWRRRFGVYIHWPFCAAKCPYCDFNSHVRDGGIDQGASSPPICASSQHFAALAPGRSVSSIFFGGGTPSLMPPATVAAILDAHRRALAGRRRRRDHARGQSDDRVEAGRFAAIAPPASTGCRSACSRSTTRACESLGRMHSARRRCRVRHRQATSTACPST